MRKVEIIRKTTSFLGELGERLHTEVEFYAPICVTTYNDAIGLILKWLNISWDTYQYEVKNKHNTELLKQVRDILNRGFEEVQPVIKDRNKLPNGYHKVPYAEKYYFLVKVIDEKPKLKGVKEPSPKNMKEIMKKLFGDK